MAGTVRSAFLIAIALTATGCSDSKSQQPPPPPSSPTQDPPPSAPAAEVLPPRPRSPKVARRSRLGQQLEWNTAPPQLDTRITGVVSKDPSARELDRCVLTAWSYGGCWVVYPTQGWIWTKFECEHVIDDDQRTIICDNYASHLAVDGDASDRTRALEILEAGCDAGAKPTCVSLAELFMWDDPERARPYAAKACAGDPSTSPIWCNDPPAMPHRFAVAVSEAHGLDGITPATTCALGVIERRGSCRVRFACGDRVLYGAFGGSAPCKTTAHGIVGGEAMTSAEDDDPAIELDVGARTVHVHDDATATAPAFDVRGTLTPL